jgi:hypothetical protein
MSKCAEACRWSRVSGLNKIMYSLLFLAFVAFFLMSAGYICLRRGRHGGLAGGDSTNLAGPGAVEPGSSRVIKSTEVALHNTATDLWLIINDKVYDFTDVSSPVSDVTWRPKVSTF